MSRLFLTRDELVELTGKKRKSAQIRALAEMGIPYRVRPDGTPAVLRCDILGESAVERVPEPDFSSLTDGAEAA